MRIIAGNLKGFKLEINKGKNTRPLKDMVRESIFNMLIHSSAISLELEGSNILDLYSGTGSFGLECLSRKAEKVYFVENEKFAQKILEKNIEKLKIKKKTKIFFQDVFSLIKKKNVLPKNFDVIFCDPPFKNNDINELIELIFSKKLLNKKGIIILHRNKNTIDKLPRFFKLIEERNYGLSKIIFGRLLF